MLVKEIQQKYPIHYLVWNNEFQDLEKLLKDENKVKIIQLVRFNN